MGTTQITPPQPTLRGSNLSESDFKWLLLLQNMFPLNKVDTSAGSYAEDPPPAGQTTSTGLTGQAKEVTYVKTSADGNTFTLNGVEGGPYTLVAQYDALKIKSDGTLWWKSAPG